MAGTATVLTTAEALQSGASTARAEVDRCLAAAADPAGQGAKVFTLVDPDRTRAEADASDLLRAHGVVPSPVAGVPVSLKDLFDVAGQVTHAGSIVLDKGPAASDAPAIARLRAAGAVLVGRTNMTEFAYSGVGMNPHYGTPTAPWDRTTGRVPGGSTSGGAVSVADGMAVAAVGTDTGGSCRIPAACCGIVGFKPTARRVPLEGCTPLSFSLDSIGPMGRTVSCVALLDAVLAGEPVEMPAAASLSGLRFAVPTNYVLERMDDTVGAAFERVLGRLSAAGVLIDEIRLDVLDRLPELTLNGGITAAEAYAWHRDLIEAEGERYDPNVRTRIMMGKSLSADAYLTAIRVRKELIAAADKALADVDALAMPTIPIVPPTIAEMEDTDTFADLNRLMLRNPSVANMLDRCAISLPVGETGGAPVGLSLVGPAMGDRRLLAIARAAEAALATT